MTGANTNEPKSEIFISYSRKDEELAEQVGKFLENCGIRCWIAHRDAVDGQPFDRQISKAIASSHATMVILSTNANASEYVRSEVAVSFDHKKTIFVLRTEEVAPAEGLDVFLKLKQWTDAFPPPAEDKLLRLANAMLALLGRPLHTGNPSMISATDADKVVPVIATGSFHQAPVRCSKVTGETLAASVAPKSTPIINHSSASDVSAISTEESREKEQLQCPNAPTAMAFVKDGVQTPLYLEPGVESQLRISPGAALRILGESTYAGSQWSHVRCADGLEAWIRDARKSITKQDPRVFFRTEHESNPRFGFVLNEVTVVGDGSGYSGFMRQVSLMDRNFGRVTIDLGRIRDIKINRRGADAPVKVITDQRTYQGEFIESGYCLLLVVSRPFVRVRDVRNEIDLKTVDYACLRRIDAPLDLESLH